MKNQPYALQYCVAIRTTCIFIVKGMNVRSSLAMQNKVKTNKQTDKKLSRCTSGKKMFEIFGKTSIVCV